MKKTIALDMDGTIVDFYGVENWLQYLEEENATPYIVAKPLVDIGKLQKMIEKEHEKNNDVIIITWLSKNCSTQFAQKIKQAKIDWLKQYDLYDLIDKIEFKNYGVSKFKPNTIIFDDDIRVRNEYKDNGLSEKNLKFYLDCIL